MCSYGSDQGPRYHEPGWSRLITGFGRKALAVGGAQEIGPAQVAGGKQRIWVSVHDGPPRRDRDVRHRLTSHLIWSERSLRLPEDRYIVQMTDFALRQYWSPGYDRS